MAILSTMVIWYNGMRTRRYQLNQINSDEVVGTEINNLISRNVVNNKFRIEKQKPIVKASNSIGSYSHVGFKWKKLLLIFFKLLIEFKISLFFYYEWL